MEKIYTLQEMAEILNIAVSGVRNLVRDNKIKRIEGMGKIRVRESDLKAFIEGKTEKEDAV